MHNSFDRIVALLLIPCLLTTPAIASIGRTKEPIQHLFELQVMALPDAASPHNTFTEQVTARSYASAASVLDLTQERLPTNGQIQSLPAINDASEKTLFALTLWTLLGSDTDIVINLLLDLDLGYSYRSEMEGFTANDQYEMLREPIRIIYDQLSNFYLDIMSKTRASILQPDDIFNYMRTGASFLEKNVLPPMRKLHSLTQYPGNKELFENTADSISAFVDAIELLFNPSLIPIPVTEIFNTICQTLFSHNFENHEVQTEIEHLQPSDVRFDGPQDQLALLFLILLAPFKQEPLSDRDDSYPYGTHHLTPIIWIDQDLMLFNFKVTDERELRTTELLPPNGYAIGVGYELAEKIASTLGGHVEVLHSDSGKTNGFSLWLPLFPDAAHVRRPLFSLFRAT